jgi:hypothetical protein
MSRWKAWNGYQHPNHRLSHRSGRLNHRSQRLKQRSPYLARRVRIPISGISCSVGMPNDAAGLHYMAIGRVIRALPCDRLVVAKRFAAVFAEGWLGL